MMSIRKYYLVNLTAIIALLLGLSIPHPVSANVIPVVQGTVTPSGDGFTYEYALTNDASSSDNIYDFTLTGLHGPIAAATSPADPPNNWHVVGTPGPMSIHWTSRFVDLVPGATVTGFSFFTNSGPGTISYDIIGADPETGNPVAPHVFGSVVGPTLDSPTPLSVPGSISLILCGLLSLLVTRRSRS